MTVNCRSARQVGEADALGCSPDVARWLHDEVVQRLASVAAALGADGRLAEADRARCHAELEVALRALGLLLDDGLAPRPRRRLRTVGAAVRAGHAADAVAAELRLHGDAAIPARTGELVADFVAEALRNAGKHAAARATVVTVTVGEHAVRVDVSNDGVAPRANGHGSGRGLHLLAARARDHEGFVSARAVAPDGWSTTLILIRPPQEVAARPVPANGAVS